MEKERRTRWRNTRGGRGVEKVKGLVRATRGGGNSLCARFRASMPRDKRSERKDPWIVEIEPMQRSVIHKESVNLQANQTACDEEITSSAQKISAHAN